MRCAQQACAARQHQEKTNSQRAAIACSRRKRCEAKLNNMIHFAANVCTAVRFAF